MAVPLKTRVIWESLHSFVRERGGDVISPQYAWPALVNCTPGSTLPRELELRRVEVRTPPATFGDLYEFDVTRVGQRGWIEPTAKVEIIELTARSTGAKRIVHHHHIGSRDEYEIALKPIKRGS
jgi:hypothetical protein